MSDHRRFRDELLESRLTRFWLYCATCGVICTILAGFLTPGIGILPALAAAGFVCYGAGALWEDLDRDLFVPILRRHSGRD